jgi:carbon-monoxide dehydrogenase large subunit
MTVLGAAKVPFFNRDTLATMLGLAPTDVDLIENDVTGFGARRILSRLPDPVCRPACHPPGRWIEDRREHLTAMNHALKRIPRSRSPAAETVRSSDCAAGFGRPRRLYPHERTDRAAHPRQFCSPYRVPSIRITSTALLTSKTPSGTYRAPGRYEASFFCERLIELAAGDLGIDSAEMRRRNLIGAAEMPYKLRGWSPADRRWIPSATLAITAGERCLTGFGWAEKRIAGPPDRRPLSRLAVACFIEGSRAGPKETARLGSSGRRGGCMSAPPRSTASKRSWRRSPPMRSASRSTRCACSMARPYLQEGYGAFASRSTILGGSAVFEGAKALLEKMRAAAAGASRRFCR